MDDNNLKERSSTINNHSIQYRNDIDGLRALSIILVVIYHYWDQFLPSGKIGVTVFFVISGYLISSIIFKQYIKGEFTFGKFYERRVRRIFPSLEIYLIVTFFYILIANRGFTEEELKKIHNHSANTIASAFMGNNLYLMFQQRGGANILTHLWSLGVEEQFYLIWPLIAGFIIARKRMFDGVLIISVLIGISFGIRCYLEIKYPSLFVPKMFCLGRFWQLFFGCLLAYVEVKKNLIKTENDKGKDQQQTNQLAMIEQQPETSICQDTLQLNSLLTIGAFVVIIALAFLPFQLRDKYQQFSLLITVIAACVMIACPNRGALTKYVLENKAVVYIGKISYDLYLWHYFFVLAFVDLRDLRSKITFLTLSLIVSVLTYEFNQRNVRRNPHSWTVPIILLLMFVILIAGIVFFCLTFERASSVENHDFFSLRPDHII